MSKNHQNNFQLENEEFSLDSSLNWEEAIGDSSLLVAVIGDSSLLVVVIEACFCFTISSGEGVLNANRDCSNLNLTIYASLGSKSSSTVNVFF